MVGDPGAVATLLTEVSGKSLEHDPGSPEFWVVDPSRPGMSGTESNVRVTAAAATVIEAGVTPPSMSSVASTTVSVTPFKIVYRLPA